MSRASIDLEKSSATTRSRPRCRSSLARPPAWGRASASTSSTKAEVVRAARSILRGTDTLAAMRSISTRPPSRSSRRRRRVKATTQPSTTTGTSQQQPEHLGLGEAHGIRASRRKRVRRRRISSSSSQHGGQQEAGNSSAYSTPRSLMRDFSRSSRMSWNRWARATRVGGQVGRAAGHGGDLLEQLGVDREAPARHARLLGHVRAVVVPGQHGVDLDPHLLGDARRP